MNFEIVIASLNQLLEEKQPPTFHATWILKNAPKIYGYIWRNIRTENGTVDWDTVTRSLDRSFSKRWLRYRYKQAKRYERQSEVDVILDKYREKLYVFLSPADDKDKRIQDRMVISLVRLGQKGNICAQRELIKWVTFITNDWIDKYPQIWRWQGYEDEIEGKILGCIRCYRYTGSFLGYLFKTLEYSVKGKPPLYSLDDKVLDGKKTRGEYVRAEEDWQIYK